MKRCYILLHYIHNMRNGKVKLMLTGIIFLMLTGIVWVIPGAVINSSAKKGLSLDYIQGMTALIMMMLAVPVFFWGNVSVPFITWIMLPLSGILNYICFALARSAMSAGPSGLTWAIMQSSFVMPFLMGVFFFDVPCSPLRLAGLFIMLAAMFLMGRWGNTGTQTEEACATETPRKGKRFLWLAYALLAFVLAGASQCSFNLPSYFIKEEAGNLANMIYRAGINSSGAFMMFLLSPVWNRNSFKVKGTLVSILLMTFATLVAVGCLFTGLDTLAAQGAGAIGYPISLGSTIVAFLIYTAIRLKERLPLPALAGVILCLTGIVFLAL